jgi:hypothetical protein
LQITFLSDSARMRKNRIYEFVSIMTLQNVKCICLKV